MTSFLSSTKALIVTLVVGRRPNCDVRVVFEIYNSLASCSPKRAVPMYDLKTRKHLQSPRAAMLSSEAPSPAQWREPETRAEWAVACIGMSTALPMALNVSFRARDVTGLPPLFMNKLPIWCPH